MKRVLLSMALLYTVATNAQLLEQDFQSSTDVSAYFNSSPSNKQFNNIGTSGSNTTVSIATSGSNNVLRYERGVSQSGSFSRTTDFPSTNTLMYKLDLHVNASTAATSAAVFQVGSGFGAANSAESNANTYARFAINLVNAPNTFVIRDITNGVNSPNLTGTQTILWVLNNSGSVQSYTNPSGNQSTVDDDRADIWAGTTLLFDDVAVQTPSQTISDLKFVISGQTSTIDIDNILIDPIPTVPGSSTATAVSSKNFTANWSAVPGANGYRLDVSTAADFSSFVTGYQGLYIPGGSTTGFNVTGLMQGTTYYYRVRGASQYLAGEFAGGNSNIQTVTTSADATLPVKFQALDATTSNNSVMLKWTVATEENVSGYAVEKSFDGRNFTNIGFVNAANLNAYTFVDSKSSATVYYRIRSVDIDGKYGFSTTTLVKAGKSLIVLNAYPSPFISGFVLDHGTSAAGSLITISAENGRTVKTVIPTVGSQRTPIDLSAENAGIYIVGYKNSDGHVETLKILKQQ